MSDVIAVRIPQENVNDDVVTVLEWRVEDGSAVEAEQLLVEVESSKATFEIASPAQGVIRIAAAREREIPVGDVLCYVGPSGEAIAAWLAAREENKAGREPNTGAMDVARRIEETISLVESTIGAGREGPANCQIATVASREAAPQRPRTTRFSRQALVLLRERGLREIDFAGRGLVRACDLLPQPTLPSAAVLDAPTTVAVPTVTETVTTVRGAAGVPVRTEALSRAKRLETKLLAWSTRHALRSAVVTTVATAGPNPLRKSRSDAAELLAVQMVRECGRLLKKFPLLNAYCSGEQVHFYERVNIGYALDAGHGLKVPVFRDADLKEPDVLIAERRQFVADYLNDALRPAALAGGTFSITDLSGSGVFLFDPLIVEGQSAILGVGANFLPVESPGIAYNLILAFDHRLVEGRTAARFLNELKERMLVHEEGVPSSAAMLPAEVEVSCAQCGTGAKAARARKHFLVQVADPTARRTQWICTICLQGR